VYIVDTPAPIIRRRDADRTRTAILDAARTLFAARGYSHVGVREIAALAGANSALVARYFGSKEGLFRIAVHAAFDIAPVLQTDRTRFGAAMMDMFFDTLGQPTGFAMAIRSAGDEDARAIVVALLRDRVIGPVGEWLGGPDGDVKAARLFLLWLGFWGARYLLPLDALSDARLGSTREWLERSTQAIIDEDV
jgi:AcrR family transcriptional regulator